MDAAQLPELAVYRATFTAQAPQWLPPLPTTALHGALGPDDTLSIRIVLVGKRAIEKERLIEEALGQAAHWGLGIGQTQKQKGKRPKMRLTQFRKQPESPKAITSKAISLTWITPVRLVREGKVSGQLEGPGLPEIMALLRFGELVQVGKGTSFGLGRYRVEEVPEDD